MRATRGGTRVNVLRRAALATAAVLGLIVFAGMVGSYANNRSLSREAAETARAVAATTPADPESLRLESLEQLDALRAQAERLIRFERERRPWRFRWGLYTGHRLLPAVRDAYFAAYAHVLWPRARDGVVASLADLPSRPVADSDYALTQDDLRAYLLLTTESERSSADALADVLLARWLGGFELDEPYRAIVRRQFAFVGDEIRFGNPLAFPPDENLIARTRAFLAQLVDDDWRYRALITDASARARGVELARDVPGSGAVLRNTFVVPGAFTREGWDYVQAQLRGEAELAAGEPWVVGEQALTEEARAALVARLQRRYSEDYVRHWSEFLRQASVPGFGAVSEAARRLAILGDGESPLLRLFAVVSRHTAVDSATVGRAFSPVHMVVPPDADRYIGDANEPYMQGLVGLQLAFEQMAGASGSARVQAEGQVTGAADQTMRAILQLGQAFPVEAEARTVGESVRRLLQAPVNHAETLVRAAPLAELNDKGRAFCAEFDPLLAKYPFNRNATVEATPDEVAAMFEPGRSRLWTFYDDALSGVLVRQGPTYGPPVGANPRPSPAFVQFFNRAAEISRGFFGESGSNAEVRFAIRAQTTDRIPEVTLTIDGQILRFTRTVTGIRSFTWDAARAREAVITATVDGAETTVVAAAPGTWALFRAFQAAEWRSLGGDSYEVRWRVPGPELTLSAQVELLGRRPPVFRRDFFDGFRCVPRVAG